MEPPVTPKPMPASAPNLPTNHTGKLFGIVSITLTGVIDTIILATSPWSWVGKSASYLLKLAPLLWWALPTKNLAQVTPENNGLAAQDWILDTAPQTGEQQGSDTSYGIDTTCSSSLGDLGLFLCLCGLVSIPYLRATSTFHFLDYSHYVFQPTRVLMSMIYSFILVALLL
ncbi:hypothetical protein DSO57_1016579 [Entomophthora muscae]|uniref:Uncharacterized protein n=1 Tax=Entomophthora muscae TaxID=34485 RepID=A0ACC2TRY1_9FUNG|nr:hypothetical protein DSO57_1016579 [Entomophthora muscae]